MIPLSTIGSENTASQKWHRGSIPQRSDSKIVKGGSKHCRHISRVHRKKDRRPPLIGLAKLIESSHVRNDSVAFLYTVDDVEKEIQAQDRVLVRVP